MMLICGHKEEQGRESDCWCMKSHYQGKRNQNRSWTVSWLVSWHMHVPDKEAALVSLSCAHFSSQHPSSGPVVLKLLQVPESSGRFVKTWIVEPQLQSFCTIGRRWDQRIGFFNQLPGNTADAGPGVALWELCVHTCVLSRFSHVWHFATIWTVARQAPLSVEFSRQEFWSGFPCPLPGHLHNPGIETVSPVAPAQMEF